MNAGRQPPRMQAYSRDPAEGLLPERDVRDSRMGIREGLLKTGETRVWRTYCGGAALERWHGREGGSGHFPEDWAASTTRAVNYGREEIVEGLSRVVSLEGEPYLADVAAGNPEGYYGAAHLRAFGAQAGFLVKLIDADERLSIQVHPDRDYAKNVLRSDYGKTESWYILGANKPDVQPCIYMGFKPGITREHWKRLFDTQDISGMLDCMHRIPVKAGECYFIEAGVPHAIGEGCFLAEVQEPTDFTMRTELVTPGGLKINENECHLGVGFEKMLDCFHYEGVTLEEALRRWCSEPARSLETAGGAIDSLIDERKTRLFSMRRVTVSRSLPLEQPGRMSILIVLEGRGEALFGAEAMPLAQGDVFVMRADCPPLTLRADEGGLTLLQSFPPRT